MHLVFIDPNIYIPGIHFHIPNIHSYIHVFVFSVLLVLFWKKLKLFLKIGFSEFQINKREILMKARCLLHRFKDFNSDPHNAREELKLTCNPRIQEMEIWSLQGNLTSFTSQNGELWVRVRNPVSMKNMESNQGRQSYQPLISIFTHKKFWGGKMFA